MQPTSGCHWQTVKVPLRNGKNLPEMIKWLSGYDYELRQVNQVCWTAEFKVRDPAVAIRFELKFG